MRTRTRDLPACRIVLQSPTLPRAPNSLLEDTKLYQKDWLDHLDIMDRSRLPKLGFQCQHRQRRDAGGPRKILKGQERLEL
jgi:hypothetical protein